MPNLRTRHHSWRAIPRAVVFLTLLGACAQPRVAASPAAEDVQAVAVGQAIDALWKTHIQAAVVKDLSGVMEIYHDDILYCVPRAEARGREQMEGVESTTLVGADVLEATHTTNSLRVFDDLAYELGTVVGPIRLSGQQPFRVTFHFMAQWVRGDDDRWRILRFVGAPED